MFPKKSCKNENFKKKSKTNFNISPKKSKKNFQPPHTKKKFTPEKLKKNVSKKVYFLTYGNAKSLFEREREREREREKERLEYNNTMCTDPYRPFRR